MRIVSILENQLVEKRIAITPEIAKKYIALGFEISIVEKYGEHLGFKDSNYKELGVKIYIDNDELAAEKIVKIWERITNKDLTKPSNWTKFQWLLRVMKFRKTTGKILKKLFQVRFGSVKENYKFPPLDEQNICARVKRLQDILEIDKNLECKLLSERTILIKRL